MAEVEGAVEDPTSLVQSMLRSICTNMGVRCAREVIPEVHSPHVFTVEFLQPLYLICAFLDISPEGKQLGDTSYEKPPRKQERFELLFRKSHLWDIYYAMCGVSSPFDRLPGIHLWKSQQSHKTYRMEAFLVKHVLEIEGLRTELLRNKVALEALLAENVGLRAENSHLRLEREHCLELLESVGVPAPSQRELPFLAAADDEVLGARVAKSTSDYEEDGLDAGSPDDQVRPLPNMTVLAQTNRKKTKKQRAKAARERKRRREHNKQRL
ncbi:hypothetical protein CGCF413_v007867 [Colletotrichum fructicola]|nr:hypothetical protein CGCF413_v007867 [Colletotrichum fructicola]